MSKYNGVEDTLFIPLNARIYVSKNFPEFFYDEKALEIHNEIEDDILKQSNEFSIFSSCVRYIRTDMEIKKFLKRNKLSNIVFLGAGLETAYSRLNDKSNNFYEVDLKEVIEIRKKLIGSFENDILLSGDMFDLEWTKKMDINLPTFIVVNGVFQYFKEEQVITLINNLKKIFHSELEMIFDITNETGLKFANKYVKKSGNKNALMHFYINDSAEFVRKLDHVMLINEFPFFSGIVDDLKNKLKFITKLFMKVTDKLKRLKIIHIKIK